MNYLQLIVLISIYKYLRAESLVDRKSLIDCMANNKIVSSDTPYRICAKLSYHGILL